MTTNVASAVDGRLQALISTAEAIRPCPRIRLLVGDWLIQGQPVSTETFLAITANNMSEQAMETKEGRRLKGNQAAANSYIHEQVGPVMSAFGNQTEADEMAMSLRDAVVVGAATLKVPAIRVPVASIQAWWNVTMQIEQTRNYSAGVAGGFSF